MNIEYMSDTGSRHEWKCVHCDASYVVTFHYLDGAWSVQRIRDDGEREILDRGEAEQLLGEFPRERALRLTESPSSSATNLPPGIDADIDSTADSVQEGGMGLGATKRSKEGGSAANDPTQPAA